MLFTDDITEDYNNILAAIDAFSEQHGIDITVRETKVFEIVNIVYQDFPCKDGLEKSSVFKKAAYFLCFFVAGQPIENIISGDKEISDDFRKYSNTIFGLYIVSVSLKNAIIHTKQGNRSLPNSIKLSKHSYDDIIEALSRITPSNSFQLVTVLLEQLVYKENSDAQYDGMFNLA